MKTLLISIRDFLVSLKLTVALLAFGMILVFVATLDQVNLGVWAVQAKYFRSFVVYAHAGKVAVPIFPGGYAVGGLLLINLIAGHVYRFGFTWRKSGIFLTHGGLIVLLIGELLSGLWQKEHFMRINEAEAKNYAESSRLNELVIVDITDPKVDHVVALPESLLAKSRPIQHAKLPFQVVPKAHYLNSHLQRRTDAAAANLATIGFGTTLSAIPLPTTSRDDEVNQPTAFIELVAPDQTIGTFLVSTQLQMPQEFAYGGRTWRIALRAERVYFPFTLSLVKFNHDRYAGTDIPKNFSSRLRLATPDGRDDREVLIYMNNPLRYAGSTFYQSSFDNNDRTTILQVVRNPSWMLPYVACVMMSAGLLIQFGIHLAAFVAKRRRANVSVPAVA